LFDQDPAARVKRREMLTGELEFRRGHALEVDGDEVPVSGDGDGVVDAMRMATANSNPWSATGISSGGDSERWLEAAFSFGRLR
jgi:hypothetical protein